MYRASYHDPKRPPYLPHTEFEAFQTPEAAERWIRALVARGEGTLGERKLIDACPLLLWAFDAPEGVSWYVAAQVIHSDICQVADDPYASCTCHEYD